MSTQPLTPEQINVLIAESLGWKDIRMSTPWEVSDPPEDRELMCGLAPVCFGNGYARQAIPNFHGSLDACATFEAVLQPHEERTYDIELGMACYPSYNQYAKNHATAPQRCLAYLKTKGLIK